MLVGTIGFVRDRRAAGLTLEQVQTQGLPGEWTSWGTGFIDEKTWIETIYQSLSR